MPTLLLRMLHLLAAPFLISQISEGAPVTEIPSSASAHVEYAISLLAPKLFVKTDEFELNSTSCMQYTFKLSEKKVKLRAYECLLGEGGFCVMNKHVFAKETEGCRSLRPWYRQDRTYAFYFTLERRERQYGPSKQQLRHRSRRVRKNGKAAAAPIGSLHLDGIVACDTACDWRGQYNS